MGSRSALTLFTTPTYIAVSLQRASWLTVVIICAIGALVLVLNGYIGYPIVVGAVGLSAAVNLL